jgi:DNA-binding CsgD family transcriptional regulator
MNHDHVLSLVHRIYGGAAHAEFALPGHDDPRLRYEVPVALLPHVERARAIRDRLLDMTRARARMAAICDAMPMAVVMMTLDRAILYANARGRALLARGEVLCEADGETRLRCAAADERLSRALSGMAAAAGDRRAAIRAPHVDGSMYQVRVQRLTDAAQPGHAYLVQVLEPAANRTLSIGGMKSCYGLTSLEANVCRLVFEGATVDLIAERLAESPERVRSTLHAIFDKCGAQSHAELMRELALSCAIE